MGVSRGFIGSGVPFKRSRAYVRGTWEPVGLFSVKRTATTKAHAQGAALYVYSALCGSLVAGLFIVALQLLS